MDAENGGLSQARSKVEDIAHRVRIAHRAYQSGHEDWNEGIRDGLMEEPLCIEVRSDWTNVCDIGAGKPTEYRICLSTGGPATQIVGTLDEWLEPDSAEMQGQDWFLPWESIHLSDDERSCLISFASLFHYGE